MTNKRTWQDALWPDVSQPAKAHYAADQGFWAAALVAGISAVVTWLAIIPQWAWVDVGLFVAIAIGIRLRMRSAAIAGLVLFILENFTSIPTSGTQIIIALCILLAFVHAVRGTFALRRRAASGVASPEISTIPPLRKMDIIICVLLLAIIPFAFVVLPRADRQDLMKTIRESAGVEIDERSTNEAKEPVTMTMPGGSKITVPGNWQVLKNEEYPDAPKDSVLAEFQSESMWAMFQEEFKEDLQRDFVGEMTLERYAKAVSDVISNDMTEPSVSASSPLTIQGKNCLRFTVKGIRREYRFLHEVTVCDFGSGFLRATAWASQSEYEKQKEEVEKLMSGIHW